MTTVKTVSCCAKAHFANLSRYLDDERTIAQASQNLTSKKSWSREFEQSRIAYGCNEPSRAGVQSALCLHSCIAFLPEEADINGGKMTPDACMEYARQYVEKRYPNQECVWVLHKETCANDHTQRYCVHLAVNRPDLVTGKRLNEGRGRQAAASRARTIRELDEEWGLQQVVAGIRNSRIHARQPTRAEKEMANRGVRSDKEYIRCAIRASVNEAKDVPEKERMQALGASLDKRGVKMTASTSGRDYTFERKSTGRKVNGVRLGRGFTSKGIAIGLGIQMARTIERTADEGLEME